MWPVRQFQQYSGTLANNELHKTYAASWLKSLFVVSLKLLIVNGLKSMLLNHCVIWHAQLHSSRCFAALMSSSAWCVTVCVRCECMVLSKINELTVRRVNKKLRDAILTCAQKLTWVGLIYRTEPTTETWKTEKTKKKETDMLRSIGRQSGNPCSQSYHIISEIYSAPITKRT